MTAGPRPNRDANAPALVFLHGFALDSRMWRRQVAALADDGDRATAVEVWLDDPMFEGIRTDEETFEEVRQIVLDYGGYHWTGKVASKWYDADPTPRLKALDVPSLVVSGEGDIPSFMLMAE